jgi:hypothetical protein
MVENEKYKEKKK